MNIAFGLMIILSITSFGLLGADSDTVGLDNAIMHYTTGPLSKVKFTKVLKLVSDLGKLVGSDESFRNATFRQAIRKQLSELNLDGNAIEAMLTANAIIMTTTDHAIFLTKREFDNIIQDYFPLKGNKVLVLPGDSEAVAKYLEIVSGCYEDEPALKVKQNDIERLRAKCKALKRENKELDAKIASYCA